MSNNTYRIVTDNIDITGHIGEAKYFGGELALYIESDEQDGDREVLSTNLAAYGLIAPVGHVYVKDYSEHKGLADALEAAGVATKVKQVAFGPFDTKACLVRVNDGVLQ